MAHPLRLTLTLACVLSTSLLAGCEKKVNWSETVTLRDGRTVLVRRAVWLGDEWLNFTAKWPHRYAIDFENPETHKHFSWSGKHGISPVMIDFAGRDTYLVVAPFLCDADMSGYDNPNPPFAYLHYEGLLRGWQAVPLAEFARRASGEPHARRELRTRRHVLFEERCHRQDR